jgi:Xaa-Pro aminopeptidase
MAVSASHFATSMNLEWGGFSLAERDRRWNRVRVLAAEAGFDGIFVPLGNGLDARYLTQLRNACMVLPTNAGVAPIVVADRGSTNSWLERVIHTRRAWSDALLEALREAGMERARIGVPGLSAGRFAHVSAANGAACWGALATLRGELPEARFEDATDVVGRARLVKGPEEIACLREASRIAMAGVERLRETVRPGVGEAEAYAAVVERLLELGSEYYPLEWASGPAGGPLDRFTNPPAGRTLEKGMVVRCGVHAIWGGLVAREDGLACAGPEPEDLRALEARQPEVLEAVLAHLRPGLTVAQLDAAASAVGAGLTLRGLGLGDDGPVLGAGADDYAFEEGNVLYVAPRLAGPSCQLDAGCAVAVTASGAQRLAAPPPSP